LLVCSDDYDGVSDTGDNQEYCGSDMISITQLVRDGERNPRKQQIQERSGVSRRQQEIDAHLGKITLNAQRLKSCRT
jgi:hypothetical protein